jgi:hypothetical protein
MLMAVEELGADVFFISWSLPSMPPTVGSA